MILLGDFLLSMIQLIVGGIIFAAIMADNSINSTYLYIIAVSIVVIMFIVAIVLYRIGGKNG
jgi:hypothetical protein